LEFYISLGLAFRLGFLFQAFKTPFFRPLTLDSKAYEAKATEILSFPGFLPRGVFYQTPFYPYLLAPLHKIFWRTLFPIQLLQILLGVSLPVLALPCTEKIRKLHVPFTEMDRPGQRLAVYPEIFLDPIPKPYARLHTLVDRPHF
jgi:hypothetical protein